MSAATSEETKQNAETTASEESENEKKLRMENESLAKEIDLLSEKKLELEVSQCKCGLHFVLLYKAKNVYIWIIQKCCITYKSRFVMKLKSNLKKHFHFRKCDPATLPIVLYSFTFIFIFCSI
jgi:uncharacterized protein YeaC (DUF1315 family)